MTAPSPHTADPNVEPTLLVFTLGASWEARRRNLLPEGWRKAEQALHRTCLDGILAAGRAKGFRLRVSSPARSLSIPSDVQRLTQSGKDFGTRLRGAWSVAQAESSGPVVLVGSDVPGLGATHLQEALDALDDDPARVVIGPSPDGGFYLLAANRPLDPVLASVCWCCRNTLSSLRQALHREGFAVTELEPLRDLDQRADLEALLTGSIEVASSAWRFLFRWLLCAWREWRRPPRLIPVPLPSSAERMIRRGRAPPRLSRSL